ncbi:hypothetical protein PIB30_093636 [Stylosanthes scabra]|uniref:Uncharacterized protein n=1 Tax=Stylosanthes scabra TaxID=79078 RepID=A0ABU6SVL9_9FABA|nr:hypothetical protein [Stylosanthes scabra]
MKIMRTFETTQQRRKEENLQYLERQEPLTRKGDGDDTTELTELETARRCSSLWNDVRRDRSGWQRRRLQRWRWRSRRQLQSTAASVCNRGDGDGGTWLGCGREIGVGVVRFRSRRVMRNEELHNV